MGAVAEKDGVREFEYTADDFEAIRRRLYATAGINLADSKKQLVYSRIARRLRAVGVRSFAAYLKYLEGHRHEEEEFINALTTNLTAFFREPHHFDIMIRFLKQNARPGREFKLWCAAASTGEEPYSMAIAAIEALGQNPPVRIIATDIDSRCLAHARAAVYEQDRVNTVSSSRLKAFFLRGTGPNRGLVRVRPEVAKLVQFASLNLLAPSWKLAPPYDLIFCRNVMIYFDKPTQKKVLERMIPMLAPDGLYIAGHSESFTHASDMVQLVGKTTYRPVLKASA